jgi:hypothetical protein
MSLLHLEILELIYRSLRGMGLALMHCCFVDVDMELWHSELHSPSLDRLVQHTFQLDMVCVYMYTNYFFITHYVRAETLAGVQS